jgi:hypothetical protein
MTKFNHKKILKVAEGVIIAGTVAFIASALGAIIIHMILNPGAVSGASFGIYG